MATTITTYDGEAWDEVAVRAYGPGEEALLTLLLQANPEHLALDRLPGGVQLVVPPAPTPAPPASLPPWKRT